MHQSPGGRLKRAIYDQWPRGTIREFARRMGISTTLLSFYLNDRREPPKGFWAAAAAELGIPVSDLLDERVAA